MHDKNKKYGWRDVLTYFRQFKTGHSITRRDYFGWFGEDLASQSNLADGYRCYLTRAGFLKITERGVYQIVNRPPEALTARECRRLAYPEGGKA
jgi:hypothetical protein